MVAAARDSVRDAVLVKQGNQTKTLGHNNRSQFRSDSVKGGLRGRTVEYTTFGYGEILNFLNLFIAIENFEARAVPLHSMSVTPRKLCLAPKVFLGGLQDRTVEYTTWVWGFTKFAKSFYSNRKFRSLNCSAVLIFRNPRKAMFGPESASSGVTGSYS